MAGFIVIGAGQAGASLVAELRGEGYAGPITLIGAEPVPPYQRPPLSKAYLMGEMAEERLYLRPAAWYAENGIDLRVDSEVTGIDPARRAVTLASGEVLHYDKLALTTGAAARRLPAAIGGALKGVFYVRDLVDAAAMAPAIREGARGLVIGGGYIGLEAAAVAVKRGASVTLVEAAQRILGRVAAPETADYFRELHRAHGVEILEQTGLTRLVGEDAVTGAILSDGTELDLDFAIVGVGIEPRTALAEAAGLTIENGIAVDELGRTSDPHIFAAGDCASMLYRGERIRIESVGNAIHQGETVARNMMGAEEPYVPKPWFWSDQYEVKLQIAGLNTGYDDIVVREDGPARSHWYYEGGTLLAVDAMNDPRGYMIGKRLIEAGKSPPKDVIADPATDLKALLRA